MRDRLQKLADRAIGRPPIVYSARNAPQAVALTFDDGPSQWTAPVAAALERHGCLGTFFMRGAAVEGHPEVAAAVAAAGHDIGNHLWTHSDPDGQSINELADEIDRTATAISEATGVETTMVRPPYCGAPRAVARAAHGGRTRMVVLRSVDPADWDTSSADEIVERVLAAIAPGAIVCMHDGIPEGSSGSPTRGPTVEAVERLVPELRRRGLEPVTVSRLLA